MKQTIALLMLCVVGGSCSPDPEGTPVGDDAGADAGVDMTEPTDADGTDDATNGEDDVGGDALDMRDMPDMRPEMDVPPPDEICGNDEDDDEDGDTDCLDDECANTDRCVAVSVSAGADHACAVTADGGVHCWGNNGAGQLGNGEVVDDNFAPVDVSGIDDATEVTVGSGFSCALHEDGTVSCWGGNAVGNLGDESTVDSPTPVSVSGLDDAVQVTAGSLHACARRSSGNVLCWGQNTNGELATGETTDFEYSPQQVRIFAGLTIVDLDDAVDVSCGQSFCCAARPDAAVCWGNDRNGKLGDGSELAEEPLAYLVQTSEMTGDFLEDMQQVETGLRHTCAVGADGTPWCWGDNRSAQSGQPILAGETLFVATARDDLGDVIDFGLGHEFSCAVRDSGGVACWGNNEMYQQGHMGSTDATLSPIDGISNPAEVDGGDGYLCVIDEDGRTSCVGRTTGMVLGQSLPDEMTATFHRVPL